MFDQLIDWLIDGRYNGSMFHRSIDWLNRRMFPVCSVDWLIYWLMEDIMPSCSIGRLIDWIDAYFFINLFWKNSFNLFLLNAYKENKWWKILAQGFCLFREKSLPQLVGHASTRFRTSRRNTSLDARYRCIPFTALFISLPYVTKNATACKALVQRRSVE